MRETAGAVDSADERTGAGAGFGLGAVSNGATGLGKLGKENLVSAGRTVGLDGARRAGLPVAGTIGALCVIGSGPLAFGAMSPEGWVGRNEMVGDTTVEPTDKE